MHAPAVEIAAVEADEQKRRALLLAGREPEFVHQRATAEEMRPGGLADGFARARMVKRSLAGDEVAVEPDEQHASVRIR